MKMAPLRIQMLAFILAIFRCESKPNCFQPDETTPNYLCPIDYMEVGGFQLQVTPMKEVLIECDGLQILNARNLPKITLRKINLLQFRFCPLPENGFQSIFNWFSTKDVAVIEYEYGSPINQTLKKEFLKGLERVRFVNFGKNKFQKLEKDTFTKVPNMVALELRENNLIDLDYSLFKNMQALEWLDLSDNQIERIQLGLFFSLKNLQYLQLWGNRLTHLQNYTFDGLTNVKSLELSRNKISSISEIAFHPLQNLANLSLALNNLSQIAINLFKYNTKLQILKLNDNPNLQLLDYQFSNLTQLQEIDLSGCNIKNLPEHIFEQSSELRILFLQNNFLKTLPQMIFATLINLEEINLDQNSLEDIRTLFFTMIKLQIISLQQNSIKVIHEDTFSELFRLKELRLAQNQISYIHSRSFFNNDRLSIIDLSMNQYSGNEVIFKDLIYLEEVNLSYNMITQVEHVITFDNKPMMGILDLRHNQITNISLINLQGVSELEVFLENNEITFIDFTNIEELEGPFTSIIHLSNNPIDCSCKNYDLFKYFKGEVTSESVSMFNIIHEGLICSTPSLLEAIPVERVPISSLICRLQDLSNEHQDCPNACDCHWRPVDTTIVISCVNRNLTTLPEIVAERFMWLNFTQIEVNLNNNSIQVLNATGYDNVTNLFLSYNQLTTISWIPDNLKMLALDTNQLSSLSLPILEKLNNSNLVKLTLDNNPWSCICGTEVLSSFIRQHTKAVDYRNIYCSNNSTRLINLTEKDLCQNSTFIYVTLLGCFFLVVAISTAFYYRYQKEIKIWLYSKNLCLSCVKEEDLDSDKIFDAFISYSHADEDFIGILVQELEKEPESYRLCLHYRDWTPGEMISTQIVNSIATSKRTIVVLSQNFLRSIWGKAEFQRAHANAMSEGRARVIVIIYGDFDKNLLNGELQAYVKTNTYLRWGDPYFWKKLRYAMPHRKEVP